LVGTLAAAVGLALLTAVLVPLRDDVSLASVVLLYLVLVVAVAVGGGLWLALIVAVVSDLLVNFFFVPPFHTFAVAQPDHVITLLVYVATATAVSIALDLAARQRAAAARSGVEAALLARITAEPIGERSLDVLLEHVRDTLHMTTAAVVESGPDGDHVVAVAGPPPTTSPTLSVPADADGRSASSRAGADGRSASSRAGADGRSAGSPAGAGLRLVVDGPAIIGADPRLLRRLAAAAARTVQAQRLAVEAARARELAEIDRLRAALLAAVGHDLRTPLAGIKAGVSSLRDPDLALTEEQRQELLATVDESTDRMDALVENLLGQSRLQAGALSVSLRPVALEEVLLHLPSTVEVDVPDDLPLALADPGLLERVVANLISNAIRVSPVVLVRGRVQGSSLVLSVVDRGPGIPANERERAFAPFVGGGQPAGPSSSTQLESAGPGSLGGGTGLGLAIAKGFTEAMGGRIEATDTPGGGLTMTVRLPVAPLAGEPGDPP
jgi:two-component system sensor histidine kinase KdpD